MLVGLSNLITVTISRDLRFLIDREEDFQRRIENANRRSLSLARGIVGAGPMKAHVADANSDSFRLVRLMDIDAFLNANGEVRANLKRDGVPKRGDETVMKISPDLRLFEIGIHSWKRRRHRPTSGTRGRVSF